MEPLGIQYEIIPENVTLFPQIRGQIGTARGFPGKKHRGNNSRGETGVKVRHNRKSVSQKRKKFFRRHLDQQNNLC
ncbi:MAG: hypothetical protein PUD80_04830 [Firmicutes bacterium]|nr:hypothetical protein [Bacillota bacterium]